MGTRRIVQTGAAFLLLGAAWFFVAPQALGGPVSYVVIYGTSMEPGLHAGDLVAVRTASDYRVGEAVAYYNDDIRQIVLHRIIAIQDGRYRFQGDNNDFVDPYQPTKDELIGEMWFRLAGAGTILKRIQAPMPAAIMAGVIGLVAAGGAGANRGRRTTGPENRDGNGSPSRRPTGTPSLAPRAVAVAFAVGVVGFGALAGFSWSHPDVEQAPARIRYSHEGAWRYAADVPTGAVYERDVTTGDPIYLNVVEQTDISFDYEFVTSTQEVAATGSLEARLSAANGWTRTFSILPAEEIGSSGSLSGPLELRPLARAIDRLETATDVVQQSYGLEIVAPITVTGTVDGVPLEDTFESSLRFNLDRQQLQLERDPEAPAPTPGEPITTTDSGAIATAQEVPATLDILGVSLPIEAARIAALGGLFLCLIGALVTTIPRLRARRRDEPSRIRARYGSWLVPARALDLTTGRSVEIESFDALAGLAERFDLPILYHRSGDEHRYVIDGGATLYVYSAQGAADADEPGLERPGGSIDSDSEPERVR